MRKRNQRGNLATNLSSYLGYLAAVAAIAQVVHTVNHDHFVQNQTVYLWVAGVIVLLPVVLFAVSNVQGALARLLRLFMYRVLRVRVLAVSGLLLLGGFTILFLRGLLFMRAYQMEEILANVLVLNLVLVALLIFVLADRLQFKDPGALLIRRMGDPKVYLYEHGVIRHIPDPATLVVLGYSFDDVAEVRDEEFRAYAHRPPIESVTTARLVRAFEDESGAVWMILGDDRRHVPDPYTLQFIQQLNRRDVEILSKEDLSSWREAGSLASPFSQ